jgi:hypothetical protein
MSRDEDIYWGVDPSTKKVAIGWTGSMCGARSVLIPDSRDGDRLARIYRATHQLVLELSRDFPPVWVWVERPSGRPNPPLLYAVGAVQAAVYETLSKIWEHPVHVEDVIASHWRKTVTGKGQQDKIDYVIWAHENGYLGSDVDEAEAFCMAHAVERLVQPAR